MLNRIAYMLDRVVQRVAPKLPGVVSGGVFRWPHQSIGQVAAWKEPGAYMLRVLGLELVLDRRT